MPRACIGWPAWVVAAYGVSTVLERLLREWMDSECSRVPPPAAPRRYLFPCRDHPDTHTATSTMRRRFHRSRRHQSLVWVAWDRVALRAGVRGPHVHPHTCRHTVAWTLTWKSPVPTVASGLPVGAGKLGGVHCRFCGSQEQPGHGERVHRHDPQPAPSHGGLPVAPGLTATERTDPPGARTGHGLCHLQPLRL